MADILASFERACEGSPIRSDELNAQAEIELRRAYDALAADFLDSHGRLPDLAREVGEDAANLIGASFETNRLLGKPTTEHAEEVLERIETQNVNVAMIRDLGHVVEREDAKIGVFITLAPPPEL